MTWQQQLLTHLRLLTEAVERTEAHVLRIEQAMLRRGAA